MTGLMRKELRKESRKKLEAYAHSEQPTIEKSTDIVPDDSLNPERKALQEDIREGCISRFQAVTEKIRAYDEKEGNLEEVIGLLSSEKIFDFRDKYTTQTYEALYREIHKLKIALEEQGVDYEEKVVRALVSLDRDLEKNRLKVVYIFDPLEIRTQIFDEYREKLKQLRSKGATDEQITDLKERTREKLVLSIELLVQLQQGFSEAYQNLFPSLKGLIENRRSGDEPYPKLEFTDVLRALEVGLVDAGITLNTYRNNIKEHLELLTKTHNEISEFLESFEQPLNGDTMYQIASQRLVGKRISPIGKVDLVLEPPYREIVIKCDNDDDFLVLSSGKETPVEDNSGGFNFGSIGLQDGQGKTSIIPLTVIRGSSYRIRKHEEAHALQSQVKSESNLYGIETLASNRESFISVFGVSKEDLDIKDTTQLADEKRWQIILVKKLNIAVTMARGEIQAYIRDGSSPEEILETLSQSGDEALYDYLNIKELIGNIGDSLSKKLDQGERDKLDKNIDEVRHIYQQFLQDAISLVGDYLRLLGKDEDSRETASTMIRFTTIDELRWVVNFLQERSPEVLTYDSASEVLQKLNGIDGELGEKFTSILVNWKNEIEKWASSERDKNKKNFKYVIAKMRWNNWSPDGGSVKALSRTESLIIHDKPTVNLTIDSREKLTNLLVVLGVIVPEQDLGEFVKDLPTNEDIDEGYQYMDEVMHNVPTNISGLSLSLNTKGYEDGRFSLSLNFDLETFHLMMNKLGLKI